jgi:hypothetical protein
VVFREPLPGFIFRHYFLSALRARLRQQGAQLAFQVGLPQNLNYFLTEITGTQFSHEILLRARQTKSFAVWRKRVKVELTRDSEANARWF